LQISDKQLQFLTGDCGVLKISI